MLSFNSPKPISLFHNQTQFTPFLNLHPRPLNLHHPPPSTHLKPISATPNPPPSPSNELYQPFRPPPSPLPTQFRLLELDGRLDILRNRLGRWFEYAPLIPSLYQQGFTAPSIEESTGITGVEQNRLVVAAQVRDSLVSSNFDPDLLAYFDLGGAEILYELRLLNASQRASAARHIVENRFDGKPAQELARAIKDFPRRRGDDGWESFSPCPGDCLAFMYYRQSREHTSVSDRTAALERAIEVAETEKAKQRISYEMQGKFDKEKGDEVRRRVTVPVVRMKIGEVAEATAVAVLPVCEAEDGEGGVERAPECEVVGEFGVVVGEKGWRKWVVLPRWEPVAEMGRRGVAVAFVDARVLPWKVNRWYKEEAILVVVDRERKAVVEGEGYIYLVRGGGGGGLGVERGERLKELGVSEALGTVMVVVRPPKLETEDPMLDEDWE